MRRKLLCAGFIAASFVTVFGCGQKPGDTENTIYTAADIINCLGYDPDDYVEAGDYRNIKVSLDEEDYTVTEQDIRERIDAESAQMPVYTKTTKKTVEDGDTVRIDYSGILDGEEEPSWEGSGEHLTIGSGQMPDGFENGLIGHSVGDTVKLDLVCPEDHPDQDLAGKKISFEVEIEAIETVETVPAEKMTDDYVLVHFYDLYQVKTVKELHDHEKEQLEKDMEIQKETDRKERYLKELVSVSRFDIPPDLIGAQTESYVEAIREEADENGSSFEAYLSNAYGFDSETALRSYIEESLLEDAKESFVLCAVMEDTGFTVGKNAFESALETRALEYGYDDVEQFMEAYGGKADLLLSYAKDSLLGQLAKTM